jgi:hypothetical protein
MKALIAISSKKNIPTSMEKCREPSLLPMTEQKAVKISSPALLSVV